MKLFFTILTILFFILILAAIWLPKNVNNPIKYLTNRTPCFEIKVVYWDNISGNERYQIKFTNDGWASEDFLDDFYDFTPSFGYIYLADGYQVGSLVQMTEKAKEFDTYEKCVEFNKSITEKKKKLQAYYESINMPVRAQKEVKQKEVKKEPEVKEVIIKSCK